MRSLGLALAAASIAATSAMPSDQLANGTQRSLALRQKYNVRVPHSDRAIYVHTFAVHHLSDEYSTIAWRDEAGRWQISITGEQGPGLLTVPFELIAEEVSTVSLTDGTKLDQLLDGRALYGEKPRSKEKNLGVGAPEHTMEIVTPRGHKVVTWRGRLIGRAGQIADIVLGRG